MKRWLIIILSSLLLTFFIYPSAFLHISDSLPDSNDTRLLAYIIGQVQDNLLHHQPLFYGRFFAPDQNTLTYSDLFLTSSLLTLPFRLFTNSPIIIFNLAFITDSVLTLCFSFLLFSYLFKNQRLALLTTLLFSLSGYHLSFYPHLQIYSLWPVFLSIYFFLRFQNENRNSFLLLFYLSLTAQIAESIFPAYLTFFAILLLLVFSPNKKIKPLIFGSLPFLPFWLFLTLPYLQMHFSFPEATRPIRDAANFSLGLEQIIFGYHSLLVVGLIIFSALLKTKTKPWWSIFLFSLTMSLGPVIKVLGHTLKIFGLPLPLPYSLFYFLFPGFNGFRTPSRFILLSLLSGCVIIGFSLLPLFKKMCTRSQAVFVLAIFALLLLEARLPLLSYPVDISLPPVYQTVKKLSPDAVILELPIKLWNDSGHEIESVRSLYSLKHRHRRLGGFSGFATNQWISLVENIKTFGLSPANLATLHQLKITHIVENGQVYPLP